MVGLRGHGLIGRGGVAPAVLALGVLSPCVARAGVPPPVTLGAGPLPDEAVRLGRAVPDLAIRVPGGATVSLARLCDERPLLLALVFSRCVGICSPFLASLKAAEDALPGPRDHRTLVLSFDPRDGEGDMRELARRLGLDGRAGWLFGAASERDVERLARALGFWYRWDEGRGQFDHPAMLAAIDRGRVRRLLVGGAVRPVRLQEVVRELRGEFVPAYPLPGRVLFRCFEYDPVRGRLVLDWGILLLLAPAAFTALATVSLFAAGRRMRGRGTG